jgi:hypothetical protein
MEEDAKHALIKAYGLVNSIVPLATQVLSCPVHLARRVMGTIVGGVPQSAFPAAWESTAHG